LRLPISVLSIVLVTVAIPATAEQQPAGDDSAAFLTPRGWDAKAVIPDAASRKVRGIREWDDLRSQKALRITNGQRDVILSAADDYQVPAGLLAGLWTAETGRLSKNWLRRDWYRAKFMPRYGSACARHYGIVKCRDNWAALRRICAQQRDGQPICDPDRVFTSFAIAMGPMQHLARRWSPSDDTWGDHVVDYDGDGVYDPHLLPDAMASAARHVRFDYEAALASGQSDAGAWRSAIAGYLGSPNPRYMKTATRYWLRWCAVTGYCRR